MNDIIQNSYIPDLVSPPGETLEEILTERGITQRELAEQINQPINIINAIINGKAKLTPEITLKLEQVLNIPATFWNNRERLYQEYLASQKEDKSMTTKMESA